MLAAIRKFLSDMADGDARPSLGEDELQLAAASLLFHVIAVDGVVTVEERETLTGLLTRRFDLAPADVGSLVKAAESADAEAVDLYAFTSVLRRRLEPADRERIIEMMWELVYADGSVHELEDNVVWRVAELLGVPARTRVLLKKEVGGRAE
ncbi:MAG: TerB family tellurite resistance protein [Bauldia sp.]